MGAGLMSDEEFGKFVEEQANIPPPDGRECWEILVCPSCELYDVDFKLIDYRLVECSFCHARIRVTHYGVRLGRPDDDTKWPIDDVTYHGVVATSGSPSSVRGHP